MNTITTLTARSLGSAADAATQGPTTLPTAAWDLVSFLQNAGEYAKIAGGAALITMGIVAVIWGGILLLKKLMAGAQNQDSWIKVIMLLIIGGAIGVGGFALIFNIGSGGKKTIEDLGGGTFLWDAALPLGALLGIS